MIIVAVFLAVIGFGALVPSARLVFAGDVWGFARALPALVVLFLSFALIYFGYRALKRR